VILLLTFAAPILATLLADVLLRRSPLLMWVGCVGMLLLVVVLNILGWHISPDYSGSPKAAVVSGLVMFGPPIIACCAFLDFARKIQWRRGARLGLTMVIGEVLVLLCMMPAMLVFVALGGDTL